MKDGRKPEYPEKTPGYELQKRPHTNHITKSLKRSLGTKCDNRMTAGIHWPHQHLGCFRGADMSQAFRFDLDSFLILSPCSSLEVI